MNYIASFFCSYILVLIGYMMIAEFYDYDDEYQYLAFMGAGAAIVGGVIALTSCFIVGNKVNEIGKAFAIVSIFLGFIPVVVFIVWLLRFMLISLHKIGKSESSYINEQDKEEIASDTSGDSMIPESSPQQYLEQLGGRMKVIQDEETYKDLSRIRKIAKKIMDFMEENPDADTGDFEYFLSVACELAQTYAVTERAGGKKGSFTGKEQENSRLVRETLPQIIAALDRTLEEMRDRKADSVNTGLVGTVNAFRSKAAQDGFRIRDGDVLPNTSGDMVGDIAADENLEDENVSDDAVNEGEQGIGSIEQETSCCISRHISVSGNCDMAVEINMQVSGFDLRTRF